MKQLLYILLIVVTAISANGQELKDTQQLDQVIVRGQKTMFQQSPEGTIVNVQGSILSKGSSVMQVLERSPGVIVDARNNNLLLNGRSGVGVMVDGRLLRMPAEQVMAMLNNMPAGNIVSIELLSSPGARYDAEGSAGIINIVTRRNRNAGTSGNLSLTAGHGWGEKGTAALSIAHSRKKISLNGSYTLNRERTYSDLDIFSAQDMPVFGGYLETNYRDTAQRLQHTHDASAGITFRRDSMTTIGASLLYNASRSTANVHTIASYDPPGDALFFDGNIIRKNSWQNGVSTLFMEKKYRNNARLHTSFDYLYFRNRQPSEVFNTFNKGNGEPPEGHDTLFSPRQKGFASTIIQGGVWKMDYSTRLNQKILLETGVKANITHASSSSFLQSLVDGTWVNRGETSTDIDMKERIGAAYASITAKPDERTNIVIGSRYEYTHMDIRYPGSLKESWTRRKGVWFPNVQFTRRINETSEWLLSYSKRISRPSYNDLASYAAYSDPTAIYTGNPLLQPAISHTLKWGYNVNGYSVALLATRDLQTIARYQITESPSRDVLYVSPQNIPKQESVQLQLTTPFTVNSWWKMNYTVSGSWRKFRLEHTLVPFEKTYAFFAFNGNHTILLPKAYSMEISGWFNSTGYNGSVKMKGFGAVNAGIKKEIKNGSLQLGVTDIFRTMKIHNYYGTVTREAFDIKNHVLYRGESARFPIIKLTYSRSFGRKTSNESTSKPVAEEGDRIRKE